MNMKYETTEFKSWNLGQCFKTCELDHDCYNCKRWIDHYNQIVIDHITKSNAEDK